MAKEGYKLSCNIMSVTIKAVRNVPNHVPHAAVFITLEIEFSKRVREKCAHDR